MTSALQTDLIDETTPRSTRLLVQALAILTLMMITASFGASTASAANGCGPGATDWRSQVKSQLVVDAPFTFGFGGACNTHDRCYGTPWNRVAYSYQAAKAECDRQFYGNLTSGCYRNYYNSNLVWQWCQYTAYGYYQAVDRAGAGAYRNGQRR